MDRIALSVSYVDLSRPTSSNKYDLQPFFGLEYIKMGNAATVLQENKTEDNSKGKLHAKIVELRVLMCDVSSETVKKNYVDRHMDHLSSSEWEKYLR